MQQTEKFPFLSLVLKQFGFKSIPLIALVLSAGLAHALLVAVINRAATVTTDRRSLLILLFIFVGVLIFHVTGRYIALLWCARKVEEAVRQARIEIAKRIQTGRLLSVEKLEPSKLYVTLTECTQIISRSIFSVLVASASVAMLIFCTIYMFTISQAAVLLTAAVLAMCTLNYTRVARRFKKATRETYKEEQHFFTGLRHILDGFKELKMNQRRDDDLFSSHLEPAADASEDFAQQAHSLLVYNHIFLQASLMLMLATVIFVLPSFHQGTTLALHQLTALLLFMRSPLSEIIEALPNLAEADIAVKRLNDLTTSLGDGGKPQNGPSAQRLRRVKNIESVVLNDVTFSYRDHAGDPLFTVGPINLTVNKGEFLILRGGNGGGKSTLLKILTGLYQPDGGILKLNGIAVSSGNANYYRQQFSCVLSDFHLFEKLYGLETVQEEEVDQQIDALGLSEKVWLEDHVFSTLDLSTGQRKRLALAVAMLEGRQIYVLDEVAADQDPGFREFFYTKLAPALRAKGKTIIVASHDRRYFSAADRMIRMDYGKLIADDVAGEHQG